MKFKVGDIVRQVSYGSNTHPGDVGKRAKVKEVGLNYLGVGDAILIEPIDKLVYNNDSPRGEASYELVRHINKLYDLKEKLIKHEVKNGKISKTRKVIQS